MDLSSNINLKPWHLGLKFLLLCPIFVQYITPSGQTEGCKLVNGIWDATFQKEPCFVRLRARVSPRIFEWGKGAEAKWEEGGTCGETLEIPTSASAFSMVFSAKSGGPVPQFPKVGTRPPSHPVATPLLN